VAIYGGKNFKVTNPYLYNLYTANPSVTANMKGHFSNSEDYGHIKIKKITGSGTVVCTPSG
jgi:hypothetical protein